MTGYRYIGTMRGAVQAGWADNAAERRLAHTIFGTPEDTSVIFTELHGFWAGCLQLVWPNANLLHVWIAE